MTNSLAALAAVVILLGIISTQSCDALARASESNEAIFTTKKASSNITGGLSHQLDKTHGYGKQQHWHALSRRLLGATPSSTRPDLQIPSQPSTNAASIRADVICTGSTFSKQSCLFHNVCLQPSPDQQHLNAWLIGAASSNQRTQQNMALLQQHLQRVLEGEYSTLDSRSTAAELTIDLPAASLHNSSPAGSSGNRGSASIAAINSRTRSITLAGISASEDSSKDTATEHPAPEGAFNASMFQTEPAVAVLWRTVRKNQYSFGHALLNEAFPVFLALHSHFHSQQRLPMRLQLLLAPTLEPVLHDVLANTITPHAQLLSQRLAQLPAGVQGVCFRQLLLGDGGYQAASRASLANSGSKHAAQYAREPSFFSSANWWAFRQHAMQLHGVSEAPSAAAAKPLVLLNDKRHGPGGKPDRRMILDVDALAANLSALYPCCEVRAVRLRDLSWPEKLRLLSRTSVFITTQGSSAFRLVFLPHGSTAVIVGGPETGSPEWLNFHELDRWFPLSYVQFSRYEVHTQNKDEYEVQVVPGWWKPEWYKPLARRAWWLYNANVRIDIQRLRGVLDSILLQCKQ